MTNPTEGIARTERYTYQSLHWGLPMTPLLLALYSFLVRGDSQPLRVVIAAVVVGAVAAWAGLVVLHTGLRQAGDLAPGAWDRLFYTPARKRIGIVIWAAAAPLACGFASFLVPATFVPGQFLDVLTFSLVAATLAYPVFGLTRRRVPVYAVALGLVGVCLATAADLETLGHRIAMLVPAALWAGMWVLLTSMWLNVLQTTKELDRARRDSARLAVTEERLRFARDLHDVLGRTLSAVALKAELGAAQADHGRPEAATTMREVQTIATDALDELRGLVRGYRETDLAGELAGARSLLEAAGITVTTIVEAGPLPPTVARCLAWVVREGTTNVLRHATATTVQLALTRDASGLTLTVTNDGAADDSGETGSGLAGLAERLDEVGGTLTAGVHDGGWRLAAHVDQAVLLRLDEAGSSS